jgi:tetratricopeptide (TPR) repeat protein
VTGRVLVVLAAVLLASATADAKRVMRPRRPTPPPVDPVGTLWTRVAGASTAHDRYLSKAEERVGKNDLSGAIPFFRQAIEAAPERPAAYQALAHAQMKLADHTGCVDTAREGLRRRGEPRSPGTGEPVDVELESTLAYCLFGAGRFAESQAVLEQTLTIPGVDGGKRTRLLANLAGTQHARGYLGDAILLLQRALDVGRVAGAPRETMFGIQIVLMVVLDRDGQEQSAVQVATELVRNASYRNIVELLWPGPGDSDYAIGLVYAAQLASPVLTGELRCDRPYCRARARWHFQRSLSKDPGGPWAGRVRSHLRDLGGTGWAPGDIDFGGSVAGVPTEPVVRVVRGLDARLVACLGERAQALYEVTIGLPGKPGAPQPRPAPPPRAQVVRRAVPPVPARREVIVSAPSWAQPHKAESACIAKVLDEAPWPPPGAGQVRVRFSVSK